MQCTSFTIDRAVTNILRQNGPVAVEILVVYFFYSSYKRDKTILYTWWTSRIILFQQFQFVWPMYTYIQTHCC